jgi:molybdopterin-guanine dinucleotide biosynthesis protein A
MSRRMERHHHSPRGGESPLPLIILGGGARESERIADEGPAHRLSGPKGATIRLGDRLLIDVVVERFRQSGAFDPIFIAGPASTYGPSRGAAEVIDTDADFGDNIRHALDRVTEKLGPPRVAFAACDVIPEPDDLRRLLADYRQHAPTEFWFPLIRAPRRRESLGAAAHKRQYRIVPEDENDPVSTLPGHLVIIRPAAIRLGLIYRALELAYRTRTRPVFTRSVYITANVLAYLLRCDLRELLAARLPTITREVLWHAVLLSYRLGTGGITQRQIERHLCGLFLHRRDRRRGGRGRIPVVDAMSLAKDIDTDREAAERHLEISES